MADKYRSEIELKGDIKDIKRKLDDVNTKLKGIGDQAGNQEKRTTASFAKIGIAVAAVGVAATKMWDQFIDPASQLQSKMANVATLVDTTKVSIRGLTESVHELSLGIPESAPELAAGLYQVVSAGVDANKQLDVLGVSAKAATAGISSTTEALNLGAAVIKAYDKGWEEFESIQDQAFKTVELGQTTFGELAQNIQKNTAQSNQLNFATQELFGSYATLTGVTGNTAEVSTQLRGIMTGLIRPKKELIALAKEQGYESVEEMAQTEGLIGVLKILKDATGGSAAEMGKMFESQEALTALGALLTTQYDTLVEKTDKITDSTGSMNTAFEKQMDTWDNQVKLLSNQLKPALIGVMDSLTGMIKSVNEYLATPLSEKLASERIGLNALVGILQDANTSQDMRNRAVKEINTLYPGYLGNLDLEKASVNDITKALEDANAEFERKIRLAAAEEILKEKAEELAKANKDLFLAQKEVNEAEAEYSQMNAEGFSSSSLLNFALMAAENNVKKLSTEYNTLYDELVNQDFIITKNNEVLDEKANLEREVAKDTAKSADIIRDNTDAIADQSVALVENKERVEDVEYAAFTFGERMTWIALNSEESLAHLGQTWMNLAQIGGKQNKTLFKIGKAAAMGSAIINTAQAVTSMLDPKTGGPPPLNYIQAGIVGAAGAAEIATIASTKMAKGAILNEPVFSPLLRGGALAGEAGREAVIPLDRNDGVFGQMNKELKALRKDIRRLQPNVNIVSEIDGVEFVESTVEPGQNDLARRRW